MFVRSQKYVNLILLIQTWITFACQSSYEFEVPEINNMHSFKGNTHTHTNRSDGDSSPETVAKWYKNHDYHFLVLSDHNIFVEPRELNHLIDSTFILIAGEEITTTVERQPVHLNGINIQKFIPPKIDSTILGTLQKNIDAIRGVGGVPHINHPNFRWALDHRVLLKLRNDRLLEIFNGHPLVNNFGGGGWPGMEEIWDHLLTGGKRVYGIAVDDAHHFLGEFSTQRSNPGRGWVMVRAHSLNPNEIVENLEAGHFYATTGVMLNDIIIDLKKIEIKIHQQNDFKYTTEFIGEKGKVLLTTHSNPAVFVLKQRTKYIRAKIVDSGGLVAWMQPVFVKNS